MQRPLISIGIPTYNRASGYLKEALKSALAQDYPNLEIIVSDNGSTDNTEAYVKSIEDSRLRYIKQNPPLSPNGNFEFCLQEAKGAYFLLLHDDDVLDSDFISSCLDRAEDNTNLGIIRTGTRVIDAEGKKITSTPNFSQGLSAPELYLSWFAGKTSFYFCSTLFNTQKLKDLGGFATKTHLFQDVVAIAKLSAHHGHANVQEAKASFRRHGANKGSSDTVYDWVEDSLYLLKVMSEQAPEHKESLERAGLPYLCKKCYRYIAGLPLSKQLPTYWDLYKRFDYSYSPLGYIARQQIKAIKAFIRPFVKPNKGKQLRSGS